VRKYLFEKTLFRQRGMSEKVEEFDKTQFLPRSELEAYQEEKLRSLIRHAYEFVPFYKELFDKLKLRPSDMRTLGDLTKLPILDKETLRKNYSRLLSSHAGEKVYTRTTSGSSGVPLSISVSRLSSVIEDALFFRGLRWTGYDWGDKILLLWGEHPIESVTTRLRKKIGRILLNKDFINTYEVNEASLLQIIDRLMHRPPRILRGYTSSIYNLAVCASTHGLKVEVPAISTSAEKLYLYQRHKIVESFGNNLFDQYGCGETCSIAFECEMHAGLHVCSEHVIMELVNADGESGNRGSVVITNLDNYAMPLIRYSNGDDARWATNRCNCKRTLPLLDEIEGRFYDFIEGINGNKVHAGFIDELFLNLNLGTKYFIREFRVVQERLDKLRLEFVTEQEIGRDDKKIIEDKVCHYLGPTMIEFVKVKSIPMTKLGKKMFVLSLLNRDKWSP
jgi:phenylacetate-CoA ligase